MASTTVDSSSLGTRGRKRKNLSKNEAKKFVCTNDGCGRSFTRAEHLQRHLLNHSTGEYTCDRCRAHFKRRDLLGKNNIVFPWLAHYMAPPRCMRCFLIQLQSCLDPQNDHELISHEETPKRQFSVTNIYAQRGILVAIVKRTKKLAPKAAAS
jgi:hypothetical protein